MRDIKSALFCFVLCAASLAGAAYGVSMFLEAIVVESWPTTEATIVRSDLESSAIERRYISLIAYTFEIDGKTFHSALVRTRGTSSKHRSDVAAVLDRFPVDSLCTVYYKDGGSEVSYLEAGVDTVNYLLVGVPLIFAILMGLLV